jgi:hypothetical protein
LAALENNQENIKHLNREVVHFFPKKLTHSKDAREWRRSLILGQGYTHREIAVKLQISRGTVTNDLSFLRKQAQDNLEHHIHEIVPEYFQKCLWGMRRNLKETIEIANASADPRLKMDARKIVSDCYDHIMNLVTNSSVVADAMNRVTQIHKDIDTLSHLNKSMEESSVSTEEDVNAGVF